ncbi:MAG: hypothetical protein SFX73_00855 [Kofleriaceae bacterium]|nr:hypothetical protein [Kofleriaceae bacterium]
MSTSIVARKRRTPPSPEELFRRWLARAALRDTPCGHMIEVTLAHGRLGQRGQPIESWPVDPDEMTIERAHDLAAEIWAAAEAHALTLAPMAQRYDVLAIYGELDSTERSPLSQTSLRFPTDDVDGVDVIETTPVYGPPNPEGWTDQTMRWRELEMRHVSRVHQEAMVAIRFANGLSRDSSAHVAAQAAAETERERLRLEEVDRARRFEAEQRERAEQRQIEAEQRAEQRRIDDEERAHRRMLELKAAETKARTDLATFDIKRVSWERVLDIGTIFAPVVAHRVAAHFGGGSLPSTDAELLTAARLRGFLQTLDQTDLSRMMETLGGTSPKALGFLDLVRAALFDGPPKQAAQPPGTAPTRADEPPAPTAPAEPSTTSPSARAQLFIEALRRAFSVPREPDELDAIRGYIRGQLDASPPPDLADVRAVAEAVEREGFGQVADLFQDHLRARGSEAT